jgi:hypothetical protein
MAVAEVFKIIMVLRMAGVVEDNLVREAAQLKAALAAICMEAEWAAVHHLIRLAVKTPCMVVEEGADAIRLRRHFRQAAQASLQAMEAEARVEWLVRMVRFLLAVADAELIKMAVMALEEKLEFG